MLAFLGLEFGTVPFGQLPAVVWALIALALAFDYLNGFHDAANSVATIVSTRVLGPMAAVLWAAFFNFAAFLVFKTAVAATIGEDIVASGAITYRLIAATLVAACAWAVLTWYWALPTSSSHALIGGLIGAGLVEGGVGVLRWGGIGKTVAFIVLSPLIGMVLGIAIGTIVFRLVRRWKPRRVDTVFRRGQLVSAALYSLGHGGNDAQKTMGIILALLISASHQGSGFATPKDVPIEVVLACHAAMALGTMSGGWRIVRTMGQKLLPLRPVDGFCAETAGAATLALTIFGGIPASTTHTIAGAIVGVGSLRRLKAVRWGVAMRMVWVWIFTMPATALIAALVWSGLGFLSPLK